VQDCQYQVLESYCEYSVQEWHAVENVSQTGNDFFPIVPNPQLGLDQRLGQETTSYVVIFGANNTSYTYPVSSFTEFQKFQIGSEWILNINAFGQIVSVESAK